MWWLIYFLGWLILNVRNVIWKRLNYSILPLSFNFDDLSCFWTWYLTLFYVENGYLKNLPLKEEDIKKLYKFRFYFLNFPYYLNNFLSFHKIKTLYFKPSFNNYKFFYKFFLIYLKKIEFFNILLKNKNSFLKFIFFKNLIIIKETRVFFWIKFLKKNIINYHLKNTLFLDFFITILRLLAVHNKVKSIKYYPYLNSFKISDLILKKKKNFKKCHNYYLNGDYYWLDFFRNNKEQLFLKNYPLYKKIWINYSSDIYQIQLFFEKFVLKTDTETNFNNFKKLNFTENTIVNINKNFFKNFFKNLWPIRHENNTFTKFVDLLWNKELTIFFLRKSKIFNKGRYSRNRQIYRTGVYMCLWINIIFVYFYFFSFYRLAFNFGFLWIGLGLFIIAAAFARSAKYRFYNYSNFYNELKFFFDWVGYFATNMLTPLYKKIKNIFLYN